MQKLRTHTLLTIASLFLSCLQTTVRDYLADDHPVIFELCAETVCAHSVDDRPVIFELCARTVRAYSDNDRRIIF